MSVVNECRQCHSGNYAYNLQCYQNFGKGKGVAAFLFKMIFYIKLKSVETLAISGFDGGGQVIKLSSLCISTSISSLNYELFFKFCQAFEVFLAKVAGILIKVNFACKTVGSNSEILVFGRITHTLERQSDLEGMLCKPDKIPQEFR